MGIGIIRLRDRKGRREQGAKGIGQRVEKKKEIEKRDNRKEEIGNRRCSCPAVTKTLVE